VGVSKALRDFCTMARCSDPEFLVKTRKKSKKTSLFIETPKMGDTADRDESDRQEQPEEILGATGLR
jgi:hypothetical protein